LYFCFETIPSGNPGQEVAAVDDRQLTVTTRMSATMTWKDPRLVFTAGNDTDYVILVDLSVFVERSSTIERYRQPPPKKWKRLSATRARNRARAIYIF
jgi:hypothetical protein